MKRTGIESSNLKSVGYDAETQTLEVEFHNGAVYQYKKVPRSKVKALFFAPSAGRFFNTEIKKSYEYEQVEPTEAEPPPEPKHVKRTARVKVTAGVRPYGGPAGDLQK